MLAGGSTKLVTLLCGIFTAVVIIMYSIATAGMTKSSAPLVNLQVGTADIHRLDVNKVVPQASNVLHFLGGAMNAQRNITNELFSTMEEISNTTHLRSLLMLLVNGRSYQTTIHALDQLTPIALETDEESLGSIKGLYQIISLSNDQNRTIDGLQAILAANAGNSASNSSQGTAKNSSRGASVALQNLLAGSRNPVATVSDLVKLGSLGAQKASQLAPYMSLLGQSNNISQTVGSLNQIVNANVSAEATSQLLSQISSSSDPGAALATMAKNLPEPQAAVVRALISLLGTFPNPSVVLGVLAKTNGTDARETLHDALPVFTDLSTNAYNVSLMINDVQQLMASSNANSVASLKGLEEVLETSVNPGATLIAISALTSSPLRPNTVKAVPPLFSLLKDSNNITDSFSSLLDITSFALQDSNKFAPLVRIVNAAARDKDEIFIVNQHGDVVERMFEFLDIPTDYRLGIFNLCAVRVDGSVKSCTKKRAVQDFDFRNIIYSHLKDSKIYPYLVALNIGPNDLYLEGRMLHKQHMYVPAMRAVLAFQLLTLIFAFFLFVALAVKFSDSNVLSIPGLISKILAILVAVCGFLSALIAAIITAVIKNGTGHDNYGVEYRGGSGFTALQWISVCLAIITAALNWVTVTESSKVKNGDAENAHVSESEDEMTKEPKAQVQTV